MWNSNSVVAWLLARAGLPVDDITPPPGGRAPGWQSGLITARRPDDLSSRDGRKLGHAGTRTSTDASSGFASISGTGLSSK